MTRPVRFELPTPWFVDNYSLSYKLHLISELIIVIVPLKLDRHGYNYLILLDQALPYGTVVECQLFSIAEIE